MKFKTPIEVQAGISDGDPTNPLGISGYLLSSDGSSVNWVSPGGLSAETAEAIVQPIKANEALAKGDPLYIVGYQTGQDVNIVAKANSSDPTKMPVVGLADDDYINQAFGTMTAFGSFNGDFDTTGPGTETWVIGDIIFVKPGGGLTNIRPVGTNLIQNVAIVSRVNSQTGELEVIALGRTNDVPNLPTGRLFVGTATNTSLTSDVVYVDDANERMGIRTTGTPSTNLEVSSSSNLNGIDISVTTNPTQSGALFFTTNTPLEGFMFRNANGTFQINSGGIPNSSSGNNRISIIGSSGNVGIGATVPSSKLHVASTSSNNVPTAGTATGGLWVSTSSLTFGINMGVSSSGWGFIQSQRADTGTALYNLNLQPLGGNVGIGTTSPTEKLEVEDSGTLGVNKDVLSITNRVPSSASVDTTVGMNFNLQQGSNSAITYGAIQVGEHSGTGAIKGSMRFMVQDYSGGFNLDEKMRIQSNGNVGIGTDIPSELLHISSLGPARLLIEADTDNIDENDNAQIILKQDSGLVVGNLGFKTGTNTVEVRNEYTGVDGHLSLSTSNTERLHIKYNGNVGINTTNPNRLLTVETTGNGCYLALNSSSNNTTIGSDVNGAFVVYDDSSATYRMVIDQTTGNIGVNTTNPTRKLHILGPGNSTPSDAGGIFLQTSSGGGLDIYATSTASNPVFNFRTFSGEEISFSPNSSDLMRLKSGSVGIVTTLPNARLEISGHSTSGKFLLIDNVAAGDTFLEVEDGVGSTLLSITRETGNTIKFNSFNDFSFADNISVTGTVTATNFILSSDETLKDNIKEIDVKHTDVNWKNFELKSEPGIKRAGVIAQELEVKHPEFVRTADDGLKSVAYIDLLITKIAELEARLEKLEK